MAQHMTPTCDDCGCTEACDPCPQCTLLYDADRCEVRWDCTSCGDTSTAVFKLTTPSKDYGDVGPVGAISAEDNTTYTLTVTMPGCADRTYTVTTSACPCPSGCNQGRVVGARSIATMVVYGLGAGSISRNIGFSFCRETDAWDFRPVNHTASFPILSRSYTSGSRQCVFHYIEPREYYIGDVTVTKSRFNGGPTVTASATFAVWGIVRPIFSAALGINIGGQYHLQMRRTVSAPQVTNICSSANYTLYAQGDSAAASVTIDSGHFVSGPPTYKNTVDAAPNGRHVPWCTLSNRNDQLGQEVTTGFGLISFGLPTQLSSIGIARWEAMF